MLGEMESISQDLAAKGGAMQAPLSKLQLWLAALSTRAVSSSSENRAIMSV